MIAENRRQAVYHNKSTVNRCCVFSYDEKQIRTSSDTSVQCLFFTRFGVFTQLAFEQRDVSLVCLPNDVEQGADDREGATDGIERDIEHHSSDHRPGDARPNRLEDDIQREKATQTISDNGNDPEYRIGTQLNSCAWDRDGSIEEPSERARSL